MGGTKSSLASVGHLALVTSTAEGAGCTVVWLVGEHDVSTVSEVADALASAIARDDNDVLVDLSGVEFMDAATVGVVLRASAILRTKSRSLHLQAPSRCARRMIDLCGIGALVGPFVHLALPLAPNAEQLASTGGLAPG